MNKRVNIYPLLDSGVLLLYSIKESIKLDPDYQRRGGIWSEEKKQLLIDSIINGFDIPKLYFHKFPVPKKEKGKTYEYAIIDGRQRLEAIWAFIKEEFNLANNFEFFENKKLKAGGLGYGELAKLHPRLKLVFDQRQLPIVCVETDDIEIIEEMFSRLNEAVPLNAAEKRNAIGGDLVIAMRDLAQHKFFLKNIKVTNKRYQHIEILSRMFLIENQLWFRLKLVDTKKEYLDALAKARRKGSKDLVNGLKKKTLHNLGLMSSIFTQKDDLLGAQGNIIIYYLLIRNAEAQKELNKVTKKNISRFIEKVKSNRKLAEEDIMKADFDLLEYDRLTQQGTNDASNIKQRLRTISSFLGITTPDALKL